MAVTVKIFVCLFFLTMIAWFCPLTYDIALRYGFNWLLWTNQDQVILGPDMFYFIFWSESYFFKSPKYHLHQAALQEYSRLPCPGFFTCLTLPDPLLAVDLVGQWPMLVSIVRSYYRDGGSSGWKGREEFSHREGVLWETRRLST